MLHVMSDDEEFGDLILSLQPPTLTLDEVLCQRIQWQTMVPSVTPVVDQFAPFVEWLLSSSIDDLGSSKEIPSFLQSDGVDNNADGAYRDLQQEDFYKWLEAIQEHEQARDQLSIRIRQRMAVEEELDKSVEIRVEYDKQIETFEQRLIDLLSARENAIRQLDDTKSLIQEATKRFATPLGSPPKLQIAKTRLILPMRNLASPRKSPRKFDNELYAELAAVKVEIATIKTEFNERFFRCQGLDERCGTLRLQFAQAQLQEQALVDRLRKIVETNDDLGYRIQVLQIVKHSLRY